MLLKSSVKKFKFNNFFGISVFDVAKDQQIELNSDVTDYYVEDNTAVQDNVALKPKVITISGYQGELVALTDLPSNPTLVSTIDDIKNVNVAKLVNKLDLLNPFIPTQSTQVAQIKSKINGLATDYTFEIDKIRKIQKLMSPVQTNTITKLERQTLAYKKFEYLRDTKKLCSVETPWGIYTNMIIMVLSARQDEQTKYITEFSITFKQMNFTSTKTTTFDAQQFKSYIARQQRSEMAEMGKSKGKLVSIGRYLYDKGQGSQRTIF